MTGSPAALTVAIPTCNRAAILRDCLARVLALPAPPIEVLVCDNASTDGTAAVVASFADNRLRYMRNPANIGLFGNLNRCLELARTPLVLFLPDDDIIDEGLFAAALPFFADAALVAAVVCNRYRTTRAGVAELHTPASALPRQVMRGERLLGALWRAEVSFQLAGVVFRADSLRAVGGFPTDHPYAGDVAAYGRLFMGRDVGFDPTPCTTFVVHDGSESARLGFASRVRDLAAVFRHLRTLARTRLPPAEVWVLQAAMQCYLTAEFARLGRAAREDGMSGRTLLRDGAQALPWVAGNLLRRGTENDALIHLLPKRGREAVWTVQRLLRR